MSAKRLRTRNRPIVVRYAAAALFVALAVLARWLLSPILSDRQPFPTFYVSVTAAAWWGGRGPTPFALVLGYLAGDWFFISPHNEFSALNLANTGTYFFVGLAITFFNQMMRTAQDRAEASAAESRGRQVELEREIVERVGIVSGRSLDDVRSRVGIDGLVYAGSHGLEIEGLGLCLEEPTVSGLEQSSEALTFYFGDDRTDEDAFRELGHFVTARVGSFSEPTLAGFRIASPDDVTEFLDWLCRVVQFTDPSGSVNRQCPIARHGDPRRPIAPDRPGNSTPESSCKERA